MGRLNYVGALFRELVLFAREHKAYWIVPLVLVIGLVVVLVTAGKASAPFIYTLF
jgi:hypothetical protein